jgi:hypothetical protein
MKSHFERCPQERFHVPRCAHPVQQCGPAGMTRIATTAHPQCHGGGRPSHTAACMPRRQRIVQGLTPI